MLKLLTGRSGAGKTSRIMDEIVTKLNQNSERNLILFVPEQMSFQAEFEIAKRVQAKSYSRLQVFSFKRLGYRLFLELGGKNKLFVHDLAVNMMITKIIEEKQNEFRLYKSKHFSFVQLVNEAIKEWKSYRLNRDSIETLINAHQLTPSLENKLHDLSIIYDELLKAFGERILDQEDFYEALALKIKESDFIKNSDIYIDGYHSFTNVEFVVIQELIRYSPIVTVLFTIDDMSKPHPFNEEDHVFHLPYKTIQKCLDFTHEANIPVEIEHLTSSKRFKDEALFFFEQNYDRNLQFLGEVNSIVLNECLNPTVEVHHIAQTIFNEVYQNKKSYSDFVIYTNNQAVYYPLLKTIFRLYQIPLFIDDKKSMLDHSLLNFIDSVLETVHDSMRYEAMFRMIKTEWYFPIQDVNEKNIALKLSTYRKQIDRLENYCLSHGIKGSDWKKDFWELDVFKKVADELKTKTDEERLLETQINDTKSSITKPLFRFMEVFKNSQTVKEQIQSIMTLLEELQVVEKLELFEKVDLLKARTTFDLNQAKKHKQVYNKLIDLFDELVLVCGDFRVTQETLIEMLQTGFRSMTFAIVPPAIDQVMVGSLNRSRFEMMGHFDDAYTMGVKQAFVLGVNENELPRIEHESGLITNKEREILIQEHLDLMPTLEHLFLDEQFIIYTVLTSASEKLTLSYTLSSHDKKESFRSEIIDHVQRHFPKLTIQTIYDFPIDSPMLAVTTPKATTSFLLKAVDNMRKGYEVDSFWNALYGYYHHKLELKNKLWGITAKNEAVQLAPDDLNKLYQQSISTSISSVEKYNSCPYSFFLERSLKIQERDRQAVEIMDIGDLYHETLKELALLLIKEKKDLHELSLHDIPNLVNLVVDRYASGMARKYFRVNERNQNLLKSIKESLIQSLQVMHYQSSQSAFHLFAVEEPFGDKAKRLKVDPILLNNGKEMHLSGIIDRIDMAKVGQTPYVRIIDYKSGNKDIDFTQIYHRLSLQLFTYLDVVLKNSKQLLQKEAKPAGVLYYHVQPSLVQVDKELGVQDIELLHHENYRMNGYTLNEKDVSVLHDSQLKSQNRSDIVKISFTANGYHKSQAKVLSEEDIEALRTYSYRAIKDSMNELMEGHIEIKPVMLEKKPACQYCLYRSICKFDPKLHENQYREIKRVGDVSETIEQIKKEVGGDAN